MNVTNSLIETVFAKKSLVAVDITPYALPKIDQKEIKEANGYPWYKDTARGILLKVCKNTIDILYDITVAVKIDMDYFLKYHALETVFKVCEYAKEKGIFTIVQINECKSTQCASTCFDTFFYENSPCDFLIIDSCFSEENLKLFLDLCNKKEKGVFITINSRDALSKSGVINKCTGYSNIGITGITSSEEAARLRESMPNTLFLIQGFGTPSTKNQDVMDVFKASGAGAIALVSNIFEAFKQGIYTEFGISSEEAARIELANLKNNINTAIEKDTGLCK